MDALNTDTQTFSVFGGEKERKVAPPPPTYDRTL